MSTADKHIQDAIASLTQAKDLISQMAASKSLNHDDIPILSAGMLAQIRVSAELHRSFAAALRGQIPDNIAAVFDRDGWPEVTDED